MSSCVFFLSPGGLENKRLLACHLKDDVPPCLNTISLTTSVDSLIVKGLWQLASETSINHTFSSFLIGHHLRRATLWYNIPGLQSTMVVFQPMVLSKGPLDQPPRVDFRRDGLSSLEPKAERDQPRARRGKGRGSRDRLRRAEESVHHRWACAS